jgi:hypothetical protein
MRKRTTKTSTRRACIEPYDAKSLAAPQSLGSQLTSQSSSGSPLGDTNLSQQPQYSGISAHKYNPQAKLEQLEFSKTDPSMWPKIADS